MKTILLFFISLISCSQTYELMNEQSIDIFNPDKEIGLKNWNIVNDDVMGGVSTSSLALNDEKNLIFNGYLSLENNGGFASARLSFNSETLTGVKYLKIKFRGDGNIYKLRLRQNNRRASYSTDFKSIKDKWVEMDLNIEDFKQYWRGYSFYNYPALDLREINSLGIQISDKQEGEFNLEIKYIKGIY